MFWFSQRAPKPQDFDAEVQPCRDAIEVIVAKGGTLTSNDFKDIWSRYKEVLAKHQHERYPDAATMAAAIEAAARTIR